MAREQGKYTPSSREYEVDDNVWTVKEVMFYYSDWIENEEVVVDIMKEIKKRVLAKDRRNITTRMNLVRDLLMYERGIKDIPFMASYRRIKDD